jgi:hypothetical protein
MPADRKSSRSKPAAEAESQPEPEPEAEAESEAPLNRAERRGRKKKGASSQPAGHGKVAGRSGPVQGPRMWTNRRGGG